CAPWFTAYASESMTPRPSTEDQDCYLWITSLSTFSGTQSEPEASTYGQSRLDANPLLSTRRNRSCYERCNTLQPEHWVRCRTPSRFQILTVQMSFELSCVCSRCIAPRPFWKFVRMLVGTIPSTGGRHGYPGKSCCDRRCRSDRLQSVISHRLRSPIWPGDACPTSSTGHSRGNAGTRRCCHGAGRLCLSAFGVSGDWR